MAVFDGVELLDVTGPAEIFSAATLVLANPDGGYSIELAGSSPGEFRTSSGVRLVADVALADVEGPIDTLLVPGSLVLGSDGPMPMIVPEIVDAVRRLAPDCRRVVSVCAGASMLAEAGLLDGKTVTTHWFGAQRLARDYPRVTVDADPIFVRDGSIWTCAGVSAGMDLTLALVADDYGEALALNTARLLVMYLKRPGGQSQFSVPLSLQAPARDDIRELQLWIADNLSADLSVPVLARRMHMSVRHFARVFRQATGSTPAAYLEAARVEAARRVLEETDQSLAAVANTCGFGSVETLYRSFRRRLNTTPADYRRRFRTPAAAVPAPAPAPLAPPTRIAAVG